ncbi:YcnI family protein [Bordetella bronchialis]|uniref:YncI copper-binding domain-containing protein n=1 Tax=Bordetella bronchialis TaxID=463025 RepID=A0A193G070_9BORD|nr:YcnI family protein [Bordetella bronchialis]ANN67749.1 hypothetical protein BAU06_16885 [Bordetella bronchialis]ANN72841.1 hypothetical protein BAU08_17130 [Bordetella bronchialis]
MSRFLRRASSLAAPALLAVAGAAHAHVTIETREAPAGSYYKAVFRVPHGCDGSDTRKLRIRIPDGVIGVKPQPKPGWQLDIVQGRYDKAYTLHGARVDQGVKELAWTGDLPDAYYDEFVFQAYLADDLPAGQPVYFPVVQECAKGVSRWIEIPASNGPRPAQPAPALLIAPVRPR